MTADLYDDLAEFHDLFMKEPWEALRPAVREVAGLVTFTPDVIADGTVAEQRHVTGPWLSLQSDHLAEELAGAGLALTVAGPSWGLVRKDAR